MRAWIKRHGRELLILFLLALGSKVWFFWGHQSFSQDEVGAYLYVQDLIAQGDFYIPLGPKPADSSGFAPPPLYYYLFLGVVWLSGGYFYALTILIIALEVFTPLVLYFLLTRILGEGKTGKGKGQFLPLALSWLYLFSPLVIQHSTSTWNPNLVPFFSLVFLTSSWLFLLERRWWGILVAVLAMVVLVNLHFQWFVLLPLIIFDGLGVIKNWHRTWRWFGLGLVIGAVVLSPYFYYELTSGFENVKGAVSYMTGESGSAGVTERLRKPGFLAYFFSGFYLRFFTGDIFIPDWHYLYKNLPPLKAQLMAAVAFWLVILGVMREIYLRWRKKDKDQKPWYYQAWPLVIFSLMNIVLRMYHGDKPDYFLLTFLPFFVIFLGQVMKNWRWWVSGLVVMGLWGLEVAAVGKIPPRRELAEYEVMVEEIKKVAAEERTIVPLSQELVIPLEYFFSQDEIKKWPNFDSRYNFLLCPVALGCESYNATQSATENWFKYDLVTPEDYSLNLNDYDATGSGMVKTEHLTLRVVKRQGDEL
jgi:hypothetical protein